MTSYEDYRSASARELAEVGPDEPRGWSPLAVSLIATLVLLLGLGGAMVGIYVANKNAVGPPGPGATIPQAFPTPTATPTATATPTPTTTPPADSFQLPDLAGLDFQAARAKARELKLGWLLVFEGTENDPTVRATDPAANATVSKGITIKIFVRGSAPLATVPDVKGLDCSQAADLIVDHGLYPEYPSGRSGVVLTQTPNASDPQTLHWNDTVELACGQTP